MRLFAGLVLLTLAPFTPASAQTRSVRTLSAEGARQAVLAAEAEAKKQGWEVSIAVVDPAGELLAFHRMDGASPASIENARGKARTAARFRRPTRAYDSIISGGRTGLLNFDAMTPVEGGIPIVVDGVVVGAIGVSGATSAQDAEVARAGAAVVRP